jgi:hypothetical protein
MTMTMMTTATTVKTSILYATTNLLNRWQRRGGATDYDDDDKDRAKSSEANVDLLPAQEGSTTEYHKMYADSDIDSDDDDG